MIQPDKRSFLFSAILAISFFLSGCSGIFSSTPTVAIQSQKSVSPISVVQKYPALVPPPSQTDMCLQRELEALRRSGAWKNGVQLSSDLQFGKLIRYDFPLTLNKQVKAYIHLFQHEERRAFTNWLSRSKRYLPMIKKDLKSAGLPLDLAYLAMIESGFSPTAYSSSRATGLWQFMRSTARQYHLKVNREIDERRDAEKSTKAAVAMLSDLYRRFGDWHLAVAAYNAGPGRIRAGLRRYRVKTFWDLAEKRYLKLETIRYVPKLMAAIIVAKEPEKYGFKGIHYLKQLQYDTLRVPPGMGLDGIALITHSSRKKIKRLNQELIAGKTPWSNHKYEVKIPAGSKQIALNNLPRLRTARGTGYQNYTTHRHETLATVSRKFHITRKALLKANNFKHERLLASGRRLRIPVPVRVYHLASANQETLAHNGGNLILHKVRRGETIVHIARQYHLRPDLILAWNNIKDVRTLQIGQELTLYVAEHKPHHTATALVPSHGNRPSYALQEDNTDILAAHKKALPVRTARKNFRYYRIERGDTLWTISQKFNTTPEQIRNWNNLTSNLIHPGDMLKVKEVNPIVAESSDTQVL